MITINNQLRPGDLRRKIERLWELSANKILAMHVAAVADAPPPVFTVRGQYTARGWSDWTRGFLFGSALLQFDAFWDDTFLKIGREGTLQRMTPYLTHAGTDDHGFNVISTYGHLWRLASEGRLSPDASERQVCELALQCSGAVQAQRWTYAANGEGFIHSFCGPHSLFVDSMRSLRSLALAHKLGQVLMVERDEKVSLLRRLIEHARTTAKWSIFYGTGRDSYDVRGRVAQESIFNVADGSYRCPNSQQGYSAFTTCMRSLAWTMLGYSEQLEYIDTLKDDELEKFGGHDAIDAVLLNAARATCDYYIDQTPTDGIPYWDTGAPGLQYLGQYLQRPADPNNDFEPVDSSAASIAAQGLLRLGNFLTTRGQFADAERYWQAGLTIVNALFDEPYLCADPKHQGLILHAVYHRPNGWDHIPVERRIPCGEATIWGDYHAREVALYLQRVYEEKPYLSFRGT